MRCNPAITIVLLCLIVEMGVSRAIAEPPTAGEAAWSFRDGDRVALIGGTFIEREQRYGYLETALTIANLDKTIIFRNLGWSGDTIGGISRSGFDPPEAGFKQLVDQVNAVKPTVIIVGYGANESFAGKAGLGGFTKGLEHLIDALKPTKARWIFLAPLKQEKMPPPLPDPAAHNRDIELYSKAIGEFAKRHGATFVAIDPFACDANSPRPVHLTDNGIHLTQLGYWSLAAALWNQSQIAPLTSHYNYGKLFGSLEDVSISLERITHPDGKTVADLGSPYPGRVAFGHCFNQLPMPPRPISSPGATKSAGNPLTMMSVKVTGLAPGRYTIRVDGKPHATATDAEWAKGLARDSGPELNQVERLREAIVKKNELFFYRWRPQNITYLLGFRKHEQGNNAIEIPQFDPLVEEQEKKIAVLKKPVPHIYELIREDAKGASK